MSETKELEVKCPICEATKKIRIPIAVLSQKKFGTIKVQVPPGAVCPTHQFIVFVDTKGIIRGYERIDLMMGAPSEQIQEDVEKGIISLRTLIQIYGPYGVFSLIHAKVFNYPAYLIRGKEGKDQTKILNQIGNNLLPEKYQAEESIKFIEETDYDKIKIKEKNALLIDSGKNILQTPWEEKLKFEQDIIKKALDIITDDEQIIILKQEIGKFIKEVEFSENVLENVKEIYEDDLIEQISKELNIPKINHYRVQLIKDFLRQRISAKLPKKIKNKVEEFLNLL